MQVIQLDLKKNPDIADFLVDKEPGDAVTLHGTIKSLDDQTAVITIEEIGEAIDEKDAGDEGGNEGSGLEAADQRNPQGDSVTPAGAGPDAVRDIGGGEMATT